MASEKKYVAIRFKFKKQWMSAHHGKATYNAWGNKAWIGLSPCLVSMPPIDIRYFVMSCIGVESIVVLEQLPEETRTPRKEISWGGFKKVLEC